MKREFTLFLRSVSLLCSGVLAGGQECPSRPRSTGGDNPVIQSDAPPSAPSPKLIVREGTEISLQFAQDLSSRIAMDGDPVNFVLEQDLRVGEVTVVKSGAKALGTVSHAQKARMLGRAGELAIRLEYLLVRHSRMRLRGTKGKEGQGKEGTVVALTILFGPIGLVKHGKNVEVRQGTRVVAYVDQDFVVPPE